MDRSTLRTLLVLISLSFLVAPTSADATWWNSYGVSKRWVKSWVKKFHRNNVVPGPKGDKGDSAEPCTTSVDSDSFVITLQCPGSAPVYPNDADADGVIDAKDQCMGEDDSIDVDGNNIPDCVCIDTEIVETFWDLGTYTTPSISQGNLNISGSALIKVLSSNGLGIVGGHSDNIVDSGESITFELDEPATDISYTAASASGLTQLEAFDEDNNSMGVQSVSSGPVSTHFGNAPIKKFTITAYGDNYVRISQLTSTMCIEN